MKKLLIGFGLAAMLALAGMLWIVLNDRATTEEILPEIGASVVEMATQRVRKQELELRLLGEETVTLACGEAYEDPGAEGWLVYDDGECEPVEIQTSAAPDTSRPGTQEIVYSAVREGTVLGTVSRHLTVQDIQAPVITLLGEPGERDYTALDDVDGDLTEQVVRTEEADRFVYTVRDSSGNEAQEVRMKAPVLLFEGGEHVQIPADYKFFDPGFVAFDMYGRDLSDRVQVEGEITPWRLGEYELSYTLSDDFGQTVSATRTVEVVAAEMPETVLQEKVIYLTFDDGPAEPTEALLDMLAKYDAKVTFFVTNTDPRYVDMIGRAYREGHSIGIHGYVHDASKLYASEEAYFDYFDKLQELIYEQTGSYTRIVRFIGGSSNTASMAVCDGIMSKLAEDLTLMGYRYYDWNIQPENSTCDIAAAATNIIGNSYSICNEGLTVPIPLQHDTGGWNRFVVERVIQWGMENGYTFKGIDITTPEVHHLIRN